MLADVGEDLRRRVLYMDEEVLVLDKPAGLPVQGGDGICTSLDRIAAEELCFGSTQAPRQVSAAL